MFLILIAPHEGGHFLVAKLFKVRVIEFSVGAGPKLLSFVRGGTMYAIRPIPIIGYVRMGGMEAGDFDEPGGFHSKHPAKRIAILAAGPIANFVVAMVLIAGYWLTQLNSDPAKIVNVLPQVPCSGTTFCTSPAAIAGIQANDRVLTVDGKDVTAPGAIQAVEKAFPGRPIVLTGDHADGRPFTYTLTPACTSNVCLLGIDVAPVVTVQSAVAVGE